MPLIVYNSPCTVFEVVVTLATLQKELSQHVHVHVQLHVHLVYMPTN